ncbi:MAG TPA: ATP-grasp domain-containing protein [Methanophagales archaeon]|nr:ATP-grasp domain-containing protein [Methanophagales archaeon]
MKIMVAEYAVAEGEDGLLMEGKAMLTTLKEGFERLGHEVVYPVAVNDFEKAVDRLSRESDAGVVIAPDDILCEVTKLVESNTVNLGCPSNSVKVCADKLRTMKILSEGGILVPKIASEKEVTREQRYVKKPRYGCASENVFIQEGGNIYATPDYIITEFISGVDISSSVVIGKSSVLPLTINKQFIRVDGERLRYEGGLVPYLIGREAESEIMRMSEKVITLLHCEGYVGIDFILGDEGSAYVLDVNPRPTTSIVGIARVLNYSVADLILRAKFGTLPMPDEIKTEGTFIFNLSQNEYFITNQRNFKN